MPGRLAIDFGTSNTVVARWDDVQQQGVPLHVPDYGRFYEHGSERVSVIPSLIHYASDRQRWVGNQVLQRNLAQSARTLRWLKRRIADRLPGKLRLDGKEISPADAGRDFLATVLAFAAAELQLRDEEIALTVPVEAFEHYEDWLTSVAEAAGIPRFRLIDEPSAAALGYGTHTQPGHVYLIFDFGGGTLDVAIVLIEEEEATAVGRRCRVLGKAGTDVGGITIDQWLFQEVLRRNHRSDADDDVRVISNALLVECERAKEQLSDYDRAEVNVMHPDTGMLLSAAFTQGQFEELLDQHDAFTRIDQTIRRALNAARERGYDEEHIQTVLMVGGSSLIPAVQRTVQRIFGKDRVRWDRPLDAVARGAAAFVAGVDFYDHIQHDYAIRHVNPHQGDYDYRIIVKRGTSYPATEPVAQLTIKATYDGQTQLGIAVFEIGARLQRRSDQPVELVFDPSGAARITHLTPDEEERRIFFWMNEHSPTFLVAHPPAKQGEPRFTVTFGIDGNKRLLITARDVQTGQMTHRDYPMIKLT
jgi:molecular chaperone DnaK (HSP70)